MRDQHLTSFVDRFQVLIFHNYRLRSNLYRIGKAENYRQLRQKLFEALVKHPNLFPDDKDDESENLVQVLAGLWDLDCKWIVDKQPRCENLRDLLGHLQELDAIGAKVLADQVADFLARPSG